MFTTHNSAATQFDGQEKSEKIKTLLWNLSSVLVFYSLCIVNCALFK